MCVYKPLYDRDDLTMSCDLQYQTGCPKEMLMSQLPISDGK